MSLSRKAHTRLERARNLGLTDVMAALSWVQMNIVHFGGDASTVTLLGWGAGASLVSALTVSK